MDYLKLEGKRAIVTGASQGIGEEVAKALAQYGAKVMLCSRRPEKGLRVVEEIRAQGGVAEYVQCDVSNPEQVRQTVAKTVELFGGVGILVNNAGVGSNCIDCENISDEEWDRVMNVDLKGTFFFCREVIPLMKAQRSGKIISMSSGGGVIGMGHLCHYATAKAALFGFIKSIARELGPYNVHANCIAVPTTVTPGSSDYDYDDDAEAEIPEIPLGRLAYPPDIANMTLYLSSSASDYVTGQVLAPNGGKR